MFPIKFGIWVDEIRVFRMKCWCLSVFANKWLCEVLENDFWDGWNLNFSVDYDRAMCQERVGENDIKVRLTVWILCAKWVKKHKKRETEVLTTCTAHAMHTHGRAKKGRMYTRPCSSDSTTFSSFFRFHHFAHKIQTVNRISMPFSPTCSSHLALS